VVHTAGGAVLSKREYRPQTASDTLALGAMMVAQVVGTALAHIISEASLMPAQAKGMGDPVGLGSGDATRPCAPSLYNC
jgi:hypothetical protein